MHTLLKAALKKITSMRTKSLIIKKKISLCTQGSVEHLPATWIIASYEKLQRRALGKGRVMQRLLQRQESCKVQVGFTLHR